MTKQRKTKICPICHQNYNSHSAISRKDNKTKICPGCGMKEALEQFIRTSPTNTAKAVGGYPRTLLLKSNKK